MHLAVIPLSGGSPRYVFHRAEFARYLAPGYLVYAAHGWLNAIRFDLRALEIRGDSVKLLEGPGEFDRSHPSTDFTLSESGSLVYGSGGGKFQLVWVSRDGTKHPLPFPPDAYHHPALSPDGRRIALTRGSDVYVYSLDGNIPVRITTEHPGRWPLWTPDGERVAYASVRDHGSILCWKRADGSGSEEVLMPMESDQAATDFTGDGKTLLFGQNDPGTNSDIWTLRMDGERRSERLLRTEFREGGAKLSPDGRWLAYHSDRSGRFEVWVLGVREGGAWQISHDGGREPLWSRDGRELFYRTHDGRMMAVPVRSSPFATAGKPILLFAGDFRTGGRASYDVARDGRFLMVQPVPESSRRAFGVVLNWATELEARIRGAR
jgi:dipeptidyl aminopeptidase/acylaminoacyl peptidase